MFESISRILRKRVIKLPFRAEILRVEVFKLWIETAQELFGQKIADLTHPQSFKNGVLKVRISDPVLAQELRAEIEKIIISLNKKAGRPACNAVATAGKDLVQSLVFKI